MMRIHVRGFYVATLFALFAVITLMLLLIPSMRDFTRGNIIIAVYYYVWYDEGLGNRHWNDTLEYGFVKDKPVIGFYSSSSEDVIRWQLSLIRDAGIDVLFISWWGPGSYEDKATKKIFSLLGGYGLKAAILVEPFKSSNPFTYNASFWREILNYIYENYVTPYSNVYFKLNSKPLILSFAPVGLVYLPNDNRFTFRVVATKVDLIKALCPSRPILWDLWPDYLAPWTKDRDSVILRVRSNGYVAITPRFDDTHFCIVGSCRNCSSRLLDPDYSLQAYVKQWEWIIKNKDEVKIIAIYSWNEYHERSQIEPHQDATKPSGFNYDPYSITKKYAKLLKKEN